MLILGVNSLILSRAPPIPSFSQSVLNGIYGKFLKAVVRRSAKIWPEGLLNKNLFAVRTAEDFYKRTEKADRVNNSAVQPGLLSDKFAFHPYNAVHVHPQS